MRRRYLVLAAAAAFLVAVAGYLALRMKYPPVEGWGVDTAPHAAFDTLDPWIGKAFLDETRPVTERYAQLFAYLLAGFVAYRSEHGATAHYPGIASAHGRKIDGLEGFSRIAPLIGAWLAGGRPPVVEVPSFGAVDLPALLRSGLEAGTDPKHAGYWGDIGPRDQRVIEAADIALAVWLTRDIVWATLHSDARARLVSWLAQAEGKAEGATFVNWQLAPMVVNRTLKSLGEPVSEASFASGWSAVRASYAGDGWFVDSAAGNFDYYNAWAFHYSLYWLTRIDEDVDAGFVNDARNEFVRLYRHLITPRGFPILGRSVCYRTAAPAPLIIAALAEPAVIPPGEARRALDVTWRYFVERGALYRGTLSQGYCGPDRRILDPYSGPASCLWGARSLVIALSEPDSGQFWNAGESPLPVEQGDFSLTSATPPWQVSGSRADAAVVIHRAGQTGNPPLEPWSLKYSLASLVLRRPFGPGNRRAKYDRATYSSDDPFCGCTSGTALRRAGSRGDMRARLR
jgi:hypothetical protein